MIVSLKRKYRLHPDAYYDQRLQKFVIKIENKALKYLAWDLAKIGFKQHAY